MDLPLIRRGLATWFPFLPFTQKIHGSNGSRNGPSAPRHMPCIFHAVGLSCEQQRRSGHAQRVSACPIGLPIWHWALPNGLGSGIPILTQSIPRPSKQRWLLRRPAKMAVTAKKSECQAKLAHIPRAQNPVRWFALNHASNRTRKPWS